MKTTTMAALAGAAAMVVGSEARGLPTVGLVFNTTHPFLAANGLQSITIRLEGIAPGETIQGIIGTVAHPWRVDFFASGCQPPGSSVFAFNIDSIEDPDNPGSFFFEDGFYAAPSSLNGLTGGAAQWDSGFLGNASFFGMPTDNDPVETAGGWALFSDGTDDGIITSMSWLGSNPNGFDPPGSTYDLFRITTPIGTQGMVSFIVVMNTPAAEIPVQTIMGPLTAFGFCCTDSGCICTDAGTCGINCWHWHGQVPCGKCEPCDGDVYPTGGDDVVDVHDLLAVIEHWGLGGSPSDVNCNGYTDIHDLLLVIAAWGDCPQ